MPPSYRALASTADNDRERTLQRTKWAIALACVNGAEFAYFRGSSLLLFTILLYKSTTPNKQTHIALDFFSSFLLPSEETVTGILFRNRHLGSSCDDLSRHSPRRLPRCWSQFRDALDHDVLPSRHAFAPLGVTGGRCPGICQHHGSNGTRYLALGGIV
jgi:hypothetical protein